MPDANPTAAELRSLIVEILAGATERPADEWERVVGAIDVVPVWSSPRSNWTLEATGSTADRLAIDKAIEIVRGAHPYART